MVEGIDFYYLGWYTVNVMTTKQAQSFLDRNDNPAGWESEAAIYLQRATPLEAVAAIMLDIQWQNTTNKRRAEAKAMIQFLTNVVINIVATVAVTA